MNAEPPDFNARAIALQREVESKLPDLARMIRSSDEIVLLHPDAFAADYQVAEFVLLGKAVKYAGIFGKPVQIVGKNRDTLPRTPNSVGN
jgi:hypothetical protein